MNPQGAFSYLVTTLVDLYVAAVLLRLLLQWVQADFYNPLSQFLIRITNPPLQPMRRLIPAIGRFDTAAVVLMLALEIAGLTLLSTINGSRMGWQLIFTFAVVKLLMTLLWLYFFLIILAVILSWVGARARHPIIPLIFQLTAPVLRPFRRFIPPVAGVDLSPLFALLAIRFLLYLLGW
ncbi:MAG: YggT family protein [Xanthomonadales bacterium]|nr:YggT family protein [Xanthomonadales bacterium]NIN59982.1 YggT family protein [Xanthomonadales bacterium]NIN74788.1 YggT family protein [Xanthomonadales bacterium]NIO12759.1 YggT family protein [Xanthomonadales bacterium]NIP12375.1 YggT family protein [Xanthomonadales bacterium]